MAFTSGSAAALEAVKGVTPPIIVAAIGAQRNVYADSFRTVFLVSLAFGGKSTLLGHILLAGHKLMKQFFPNSLSMLSGYICSQCRSQIDKVSVANSERWLELLLIDK